MSIFSPEPQQVLLGLGTNMDNRIDNLQHAVRHLVNGHILTELALSPVYETEALLLPNSPPEWNIPFLNMALCGKTRLTAQHLLSSLKDIEGHMGRHPIARWEPRIIDLDILLYGHEVIIEPDLHVPHPQFLHRHFALIPASSIMPHTIVPGTGQTIELLAQSLSSKPLTIYAHTTDWYYQPHA